MAALVDAKRADAGIVWGLGAHVIKTGLGPILIDLMERGFVSASQPTAPTIIHDFEIALVGATSEDVDESLGPGRFGMADETGRVLNDAIAAASPRDSASARRSPVSRAKLPQYSRSSVLASAARLGYRSPSTWHRHRHHPHASRRVGRSDWRGQPARLPILRVDRRAPRARRLSELRVGGLLPEVFLKAIALARNRGIALANVTTVNMDFVRLSARKPTWSIARRPAPRAAIR